jgi:hypothetical protein
MFTRRFWMETAERATKTAAQAAILALGASEALDLFALDVLTVVSFALGGALLSVLSSIASAPFGADRDSPSVTR